MRHYPWHYALFLALYYMTNGVYQGFITVYYKDVGLSTQQIGLLQGAIPIVALLSQPFWGAMGDRARSRNNVLRIMILGAMGCAVLFALNTSFGYLAMVVCLFSAFYTSLQPMGDSIVLEGLHRKRFEFGPARLCGCLSFALCNAFAGSLLEGHMDRVPWYTALLLGVTFVATFALPHTQGHSREKNRQSIRVLLRMPGILPMLTLLALLQITMGYFFAFYSVHFTSLPGGTATRLGWAYVLSAVSEVPFLLLSNRLFRRLGAGRLMLIAAVALTTRWTILAATENIYWVLLSQVLHGWGFIVMTVSTADYISRIVPPELRARGQMLLSIVGFGLARVVGNLGGGLLGGAIGLRAGFAVCAAITLVSLAVFAPRYLRGPVLNGD